MSAHDWSDASERDDWLDDADDSEPESDIDTTPFVYRVKCPTCSRIETMNGINEDRMWLNSNPDGTYQPNFGECYDCLRRGDAG